MLDIGLGLLRFGLLAFFGVAYVAFGLCVAVAIMAAPIVDLMNEIEEKERHG